MSKFQIDPALCTGCGGCASLCPVLAVRVDAVTAHIENNCIGCGLCADFCPISAVSRV